MKNKGIALPFVMFVIVVLLMFMTTLVNLVRQDTKWGIKHDQSVTAYHLAEAAVDRGLWKLRESVATWDSVASGTLHSNYRGGKVFTELETGSYKIIISTTTDVNQRKIVGIGRDDSTNEVKAIEYIVGVSGSVESAIIAPSLHCQGSVIIHWGPIMSNTQMTLQGAAGGRYYPRKYSVGMISPRDTSSASPNTDGVEYWAYYPVPDPPDLNFTQYIQEAQADGEYYSGYKEFKNINVGHGSADKTYYVGGNCSLRNSYLKGTLIVRGNLSLNGNGKGSYSADIPANAEAEYQHASAQPVWNASFAGNSVYSLSSVGFEGFVYVGGDWTGHGNQNFHGVVQVDGSTAGLAGNVAVYYKDNVEKEIETTELNITSVSWQEISAKW